MMEIFVFVFSLCVGSFINVVAYSIPRKLDFISRRSQCDICHVQLSMPDMIPLISYILLDGKCRYCHSHISIRYFIVEMMSGIVGVLFYWKFGLCFFIFVFFSILMLLSLIDLDSMIVYDELLVLLFCVEMFLISMFPVPFLERIVSFIFTGILFLCFNNFIIESFGGGDIKLFMVLGFLFGVKGIVLIFTYSVLSSCFVCMFLLVFKKLKFDSYIPFVPFICLGTLIYILKI